jgi:hypothetical protein
MPVILSVPQDPTDMVMAGEQMRMSIMEAPVAFGSAMFDPTVSAFQPVIQDEDAFSPMNSFIEGNRLSIRRAKNGELQVRVNAGIATPCGAWLFLDYTPLINPFIQASTRFFLRGITKDGSGAALGNCKVVVFNDAQYGFGLPDAVVGIQDSDGLGNFSIEVSKSGGLQALSYKPGSPDLAGVTDYSIETNDIA